MDENSREAPVCGSLFSGIGGLDHGLVQAGWRHAFFCEADAGHAVSAAANVRRLTPVECERLQALPDGWTDLGGTPDSKRYAALGDAVTASVAAWIGARIIEAGRA